MRKVFERKKSKASTIFLFWNCLFFISGDLLQLQAAKLIPQLIKLGTKS